MLTALSISSLSTVSDSGYCIAGCLFDVPRMNKKDNLAYKCITRCVDCVDFGQALVCLKVCHTGAIHFGTKVAMKIIAAARVDELNTRSYQNAGLCDLDGMGGW
jgi:formate dehydrogenase iron-sulfur subunit